MHVAQRNVGADRLRHQQTFALAILSDQRDTLRHRVGWRANADLLQRPSDFDVTAVGNVCTVDKAQQLGTPGTDQPGNTEDFTSTHVEGHILNLAGATEPLD